MPVKLTADFSTQSLQTRREWCDVFSMMKGEKLQSRICYLSRLSFGAEEEIKIFPDKQRLKKFITAIPTVQEMLKGNSLSGKEKT